MPGFSKRVKLDFLPTFKGDPRLRLDSRPRPEGPLEPMPPLHRAAEYEEDQKRFDAQTAADGWLADFSNNFPALAIDDAKRIVELTIDSFADNPFVLDLAFIIGNPGLVDMALGAIGKVFPEAADTLRALRELYLQFPGFNPQGYWWKDKAEDFQQRWVMQRTLSERQLLAEEIGELFPSAMAGDTRENNDAGTPSTEYPFSLLLEKIGCGDDKLRDYANKAGARKRNPGERAIYTKEEAMKILNWFQLHSPTKKHKDNAKLFLDEIR